MPFNSDNLQLFLDGAGEKDHFQPLSKERCTVPSAVSMAVSNLEAELGFCTV